MHRLLDSLACTIGCACCTAALLTRSRARAPSPRGESRAIGTRTAWKLRGGWVCVHTGRADHHQHECVNRRAATVLGPPGACACYLRGVVAADPRAAPQRSLAPALGSMLVCCELCAYTCTVRRSRGRGIRMCGRVMLLTEQSTIHSTCTVLYHGHGHPAGGPGGDLILSDARVA